MTIETDPKLSTDACLYKRKFFAKPLRGTLSLNDHVLRFVATDGHVVFAVPAKEVWLSFERFFSGMDVLLPDHAWWVGFGPPPPLFQNLGEQIHASKGGRLGQVGDALAADKLLRKWKTAAQAHGLRVAAKSEWNQERDKRLAVTRESHT